MKKKTAVFFAVALILVCAAGAYIHFSKKREDVSSDFGRLMVLAKPLNAEKKALIEKINGNLKHYAESREDLVVDYEGDLKKIYPVDSSEDDLIYDFTSQSYHFDEHDSFGGAFDMPCLKTGKRALTSPAVQRRLARIEWCADDQGKISWIKTSYDSWDH